MEERRKKGLCFNCDEKFQPGHHCKSAKLFLLKGLYPFQGSRSNVQLVELDESDMPLSHESDMPLSHSKIFESSSSLFLISFPCPSWIEELKAGYQLSIKV